MITFTVLLFDLQVNVDTGYRNVLLKIFNGYKPTQGSRYGRLLELCSNGQVYEINLTT